MKDPEPAVGLEALSRIIKERSFLGPLEVMAKHMGKIFRIPMPGFKPVVIWGHTFAHQVLIDSADHFLWRNNDPVRDVLCHGVLVTDGEQHDHLRGLMEPSLKAGVLDRYQEMMVEKTRQVYKGWKVDAPLDMLVEGRKIALLIVFQALFSVDVWNDIPKLWDPIQKIIRYISPGPWIIWRGIPRIGYRNAFNTMDAYLYAIIEKRRAGEPVEDMLQSLLDAGLSDELVKDQMLTMLIAGHDTSTALFAWFFAMMGTHPEIYAELDRAIDACEENTPPRMLDEIIRETLRLYPPIHIGNRMVAEDTQFGEDDTIQKGERLFYSIYLTHRDPEVWEDPEKFCPARFAGGTRRVPMSYIPFGGGGRSCIGSAFGSREAKVTLFILLRNFSFTFLNPEKIKPKMGATLEPSPGVFVWVARKS